MCLGIPGQVVEVLADYDDQLALVDVQGAQRRINLGLLEPDQEALNPGDWVLIHMGFALERIDEAEAEEALAGLELMGQARAVTVPGPVLFARYAFPPNSHGYCGPNDSAAFFEYGVAGADDRGLRALSQQFAGAWPYLELIASATGVEDPLDPRVVEAYWVGSPRLDQVSTRAVGNSIEERFRRITGGKFATLTASVLAGGVPHHSFAVFCIYPWTGLLSDGRKAKHALTVLDRCRIRWGQVRAVTGDQVVVESRSLTWDGHLLGIGEPEAETVVRSIDGVGMIGDLQAGDWVSLHWEWICDRLTPRQVGYLRDFTHRHLHIVNDGNLHAGPAALLGS